MNCVGYLYIPDIFCVQTQRLRPELSERPFWMSLNGKVLAATSEMERLGIRTGVSARKAMRIAPGVEQVEYRPEDFQDVSDLLCRVVYRFTPIVEPFRPGEIFLGLQTHNWEATARVLLAEMRDLGFEAVIGVAQSRLAARLLGRRIAQEQKNSALLSSARRVVNNKRSASYLPQHSIQSASPTSAHLPHFACLQPDQHIDFIAPYPVEALWTTSRKLRERLKRLGMLRVSHVQRFHRRTLFSRFGNKGYALFEAARGLDTQPLRSAWPPKTFSVQRRCEELQDRELIFQHLLELSAELSNILKSDHSQCRKLSLEILEDGCIMPASEAMAINPPVCSPNRLYLCALRLFERMRLVRPVESIRITAEDLSATAARQLDLFIPLRALEGQKEELKAFLTVRFGTDTLRFCSDIAVAWRERMLRFY